MLPLAEWAMRGRGQALGCIVILLITSPIIWPNSILAAAILALVTLRIGEQQGIQLMLWSLLPLMVLSYMGELMPGLMLSFSLLMAVVLRRSQSWPVVLMLSTIAALLLALLVYQFAQETLDTYLSVFEKMLDELKNDADAKQIEAYEAFSTIISREFFAGTLALLLSISSFLAMILARYWQAALYNPGGFQQEFHQLRMSQVWAVLSLLAAVYLLSLGKQYVSWVWLVLFPMIVSGFALFHAAAKRKNLRKHWYVIFYIIVLFGDIPKMILVLLALTDSFANLRQKLSEQKTD